jgi:glycerol-3-phosphate dehydrogenase
VVVNATGPWVDRLRQRDDVRSTPLLRLTKGAHVAVRRARLGHTHAVTFTSPIDGRVMFVLPWGDLSYVGTTDTEEDVSPDDVRATGADVVYLLRSVNALFPDARLTPRDVLATWAGLRALLAPPHERELAPSQVSREHRVVEAPSGLITIAGGKLTTFRIMGQEVVDHVSRRLRAADGRPLAPRPATDRMPLVGGESPNLEALGAALHSRGIPEVQAVHLVRYYGSEAAALGNLVDRDHALGDAIIPGRPEIWAEIVHAIEREMAVRLSDMMIRRLHLFYEDSAQGVSAAPAVAARMAALLGWDDARRAAELDAYRHEVAQSRAFLDEVPRISSPVT